MFYCSAAGIRQQSLACEKKMLKLLRYRAGVVQVRLKLALTILKAGGNSVDAVSNSIGTDR